MPVTSLLEARASHSAVWTGTEMIIWGGITNSGLSDRGYRYNPLLNTWITITPDDPNRPSARWNHTAVWVPPMIDIEGQVVTGTTFEDIRRVLMAMLDVGGPRGLTAVTQDGAEIHTELYEDQDYIKTAAG